MEILEEVHAHVDELPRGLTAEKIRERGTVLDVTEDAIEFEVERHKSASGALYTDGLAMSAFVTYWPRYRYDRDTGTLTELEERRPREFECDYDRLADELLAETFELRVEPRGNPWVCEEQVVNKTVEVEGPEDVEAFAERLMRDWNLQRFFGPELEEVLDAEERAAHFSRLEAALVAEARRHARAAWARRADP